MIAISILMLTLCLILIFLVFHKVRRIHVMMFDQTNELKKSTDNNYTQIEALMGIYQSLELEGALPALRGWAGSPDYLLTLTNTVLKEKPKSVVECGSGSSSVVIAAALKKNGVGHLYSLDHSAEFAEKTRCLLDDLGLSEWVTVLDAPLIEIQLNGEVFSWYDVSKLNVESIELLNVDGPPLRTNRNARYPVLPILSDNLSGGATILLDDAGRQDELETVQRWKSEGLIDTDEYIATEKGLAIMSAKA